MVNKTTGALSANDQQLLQRINSLFELGAGLAGPDPYIYMLWPEARLETDRSEADAIANRRHSVFTTEKPAEKKHK